MSLLCEVIPRGDSDPHQLRALGGAIRCWYERERGGSGLAHYVDTFALDDLLSGELPQPFALRFSTIAHPMDSFGRERPTLTVEQLRSACPDVAASRTLFLKVWGCNRERTILSLRRS
ncbi:MAG: hypothetical protein AB7K24_12610, partial [Gemmataceae bacterium]